jgi:hypothetical protein
MAAPAITHPSIKRAGHPAAVGRPVARRRGDGKSASRFHIGQDFLCFFAACARRGGANSYFAHKSRTMAHEIRHVLRHACPNCGIRRQPLPDLQPNAAQHPRARYGS